MAAMTSLVSAAPSASIAFAGFHLDLASERLTKDGRVLSLRRKPYLILSYLARNPRRLITREELVSAVWGHSAMSESLVRTHIRDLRRALGGGLVETVVGRGYRFEADVARVEDTPCPQERLIGRKAELGQLRRELESIGEHGLRAVIVMGEAGVGKTTLVEHFANDAAVRAAAYVGRGACIEPHGNTHPYLPVLDALSSLCRGPRGYRVIDVMACHAPGWLAQIPGIVRADRLSEYERWAARSTHANMLSELASALEALSSDASIVLVFEDLHWVDGATVELLEFLCQPRRPLRCLILGTIRPSEVARTHPLSRGLSEWIAHGRALPLDLDGFGAEALDDYLVGRFPGHSFADEFTSWLLEATCGNPLLVEVVVSDLEQRALIAEHDGGWQLATTVDKIRAQESECVLRVVDAQLDRLGDIERRVLEVGSAAGTTFTTSLVARAMGADLDEVHLCCAALAQRRRLLVEAGSEERPDGTIQCRYRFRQSLLLAAVLRRGRPSMKRSRRSLTVTTSSAVKIA